MIAWRQTANDSGLAPSINLVIDALKNKTKVTD